MRLRATLTRALALGAAPAALVALAGCSGPLPADLFLVQRTGSVPGARLTLRVTDDGGAYCNRGPRREITSAQLIQARALRRALDGQGSDHSGLAQQHLRLPPGRVSTMSYRVRSEGGTVAFSDTSAHQPLAFYQLAELTRQIARGPCRLPR